MGIYGWVENWGVNPGLSVRSCDFAMNHSKGFFLSVSLEFEGIPQALDAQKIPWDQTRYVFTKGGSIDWHFVGCSLTRLWTLIGFL